MTMQRMPHLNGQVSNRLSRHCDGDEARGVARGVALEEEGPLADVNINALGRCLGEGRGVCCMIVTGMLRPSPLMLSLDKPKVEVAADACWLWQQVCRQCCR